MSETLINSFNLFIDTDQGNSTGVSTGDEYEIHLNSVNIDAAKGQFIRLTLTNFSMFKNFTNINQHNSRFALRDGTNQPATLDLTHTNYEFYNEIALDFATKIKDQFTSWGYTLAGTPITDITPAANVGSSNTTNRIISFKLNFAASGHGLNAGDVKVQFYEKYGDVDSDIYSLLGGNRIRGEYSATDATSPSSITVDVTSTTELTFTCLYPAQKYTEQFVYLRSNLPSNNLETTSLRAGAGGSQDRVNDAHHSEIFARFPIDNEFIHWDNKTDREWFIDLPTSQNHLNFVKFRLTNAHGRNIGFYQGQNTLGNLNFTMAIRVDILQKYKPGERFTPDVPRSVPPRFSNPQLDYDGHKR